jgi:DNA-binding protein H-NS
LTDVVGGRGKGRGKSLAGVRFRHPDNSSLTWSGRGRKPKWLVEAGGDPERFRVR